MSKQVKRNMMILSHYMIKVLLTKVYITVILVNKQGGYSHCFQGKYIQVSDINKMGSKYRTEISVNMYVLARCLQLKTKQNKMS